MVWKYVIGVCGCIVTDMWIRMIYLQISKIIWHSSNFLQHSLMVISHSSDKSQWSVLVHPVAMRILLDRAIHLQDGHKKYNLEKNPKKTLFQKMDFS
jgi:hypothetical protein